MRTMLVVRLRQVALYARLLITFKKSLSPPISIAFVKCVIAKVKLLAAQAAAPSSFSSRLVIALIDLSQLRDAWMSEVQWSLRAIRLASHTYRRKCNRSLKAETFDLFQDLELGTWTFLLVTPPDQREIPQKVQEPHHRGGLLWNQNLDRPRIPMGEGWKNQKKIKKNPPSYKTAKQSQCSLPFIQKLKVMSSSYPKCNRLDVDFSASE